MKAAITVAANKNANSGSDVGTETWSVMDTTLPIAKRIMAAIVLLTFGPVFVCMGLLFLLACLVKVGLCYMGLVEGEYRDGTWHFGQTNVDHHPRCGE